MKYRKYLLCVISFIIFCFGVFTISKPVSKVIGVSLKRYGAPANINFTDDRFYRCVIDAYNIENETNYSYSYNMSDDELASIQEISCSRKSVSFTNGIEKLTGLRKLDLSVNYLKSIDVSNNTLLTELILGMTETHRGNNRISSIDVSNNTELTKLDLSGNELTGIDLSKNVNLASLNLSENDLINIDLSKNVNLTSLNLAITGLTEIDLSNNINLTSLNLAVTDLTEIDLSKNVNLTSLNLSATDLIEIDLSNNINLVSLELENINLTEIDLSNNVNLISLNLSENDLVDIDLGKNVNLTSLNLDDNSLTEIDLSKNVNLTSLSLNDNSLIDIDLSKNVNLTSLSLNDNSLIDIDLTNNTNLASLNLYYNSLTEIDLSKNTDLVSLELSHNNLTEIDLSKNVNLTSLSLNDNSLTEIDLSKNVNLTSLNLNDNSLIDIDLSKNVNLTSLGLNGNSLKNVDLSKNVALTFLGLSGNSLKNVDLSKNVNLTSLNLSHNSLTEIDLSSNTELTRLDLSYNGLRSVDLSGLTSNLTYFTFSNQERNIKHVKDGEEVEGELGELVPQYGYVNKYTVPVTITGYETNQDYTLDYNVSWINVILGNGMPIYSASISEFLSQRSCLNSNKCEFYVNDGENDLTEGLFEDKAYTLKVYDDGDFLKEYSLVFGVREINLDVQNLRLGLEDEYYLSPIFTPEYAYNQDVTWSSSDESVATVDENGMVTAVGVGEAVIIVRADDSSKIARCNVTVVEVLEHKVTYILGDGESIEKNFVPETDIIAGFNEPDLLYKFGFKLIGWTYNYRDYNLDDELLMPSYDIEVTAIWETISDTSSKYQIETFDDGKVVKDVHPNTKIVSYFDLGLGEEYIVRVFTSNGILQKVSGTIGTGNLARVYVDGKLVDEYVISVKGDLNGGGTVNATDMISLRRYIKMALNEENVDSCYRLAGDFTGNGKINANDMIGLRSYIKEVLSSDD